MLEKYISELQERIRSYDTNIPNAENYIRELKETLDVAKKFEKLCNNLKEHELIKSPYSNSFYLVPKGPKVNWGTKPEGSYRFSNHWNWGEKNEYTGLKTIHCPTDTGEDFGVAIAVVENGEYKKVY